jgi:uncharacterized protein YyaL (SSP411 family)
MITDHLAAARAELAVKTKAKIDADTADVWGARAVAAMELYRATGNVAWYGQAVEYRHEAIEHASGGPAGTLESIQAQLALSGL